jgi:transglutaminase-like putative cysteine protease
MRLPIAAGLATGAVALTLYPLFKGGLWISTGLATLLAVTAVGVLASHFTLDRRLVAPVQLLALWLVLTWMFAGEHTWAWLLPSRDSVVALWLLLGEGFADIQRYAAPVPVEDGIALLTAGGIGLIAILVDLFAVRLRRAALAGLPLLALFSVPAAVVNDPIAWPVVVVAALGYIGLLLSDGRERIGQWGRAVLVRRSQRAASTAAPGTYALRSAPFRLSGKRIGFAAIGLAVLLPALVPTLQPDPLFGFGVGNGAGEGGNTITIPNPVAGMRGQLTQQQNATVLNYTTSDGEPHYLRLWSLDEFDGEEWGMTAPRGRPEDRVSEGPLPAPPGLGPSVPVKRVTSRITMSEGISRLHFLPLPYPPTEVAADGDWRADRSTLMVFSTREEARGLTFDVVSTRPEPTPEILERAAPPPADVIDRYLQVPPTLPSEIIDLAEEVTRDAKTPYAKAVRLQQWFTEDGDFTYSLETRGQSNSALIDFLIRNRTGYCEQFAAAMAIMARVLDIPSRVAIGYTGGTPVQGGFQVGTHDAHAWPELYFQGVGWLRFEPTPGGGLGQGTASAPDYSEPPAVTSGEEEGASPAASASAAPESGSDDDAAAAERRNPRELDPDFGGAPVELDEGMPLAARIAIGVGALLLVALLPAAWRLVIRMRRRRVWTSPPAAPQAAVPGAAGAGAQPTAGG